MPTASSSVELNSDEKRAAYSLATIYAMRMLGLFMILPVFSLYASQLQHSTPALTGMAIGAYGLTQALLQIPFGVVSDKLGRKPVIIAGMLLFALGSIIAGASDSIYGVILGRLLQGSGAVAAVLMATAADLTREQNRLKVMAIIGMSIGMSFALAMVAGSILQRWIGVDGIFYLTGILALCGIAITVFIVPDIRQHHLHRDTDVIINDKLLSILLHPQLLRLDVGIFILHMVLTATFLVIPLLLVNPDYVALPVNAHWKVYLPIMLIAMLMMVPFIIIAESRRKMKQVFSGAILTLCVTQVLFFFFYQDAQILLTTLLIFFVAFNILEASLPSLVAKISPAEKKGTAMGIYSTAQFLGAFCGGVISGNLYQHFGVEAVFGFSALALSIWYLLAMTMKNPRYLSNYIVKVDVNADNKNKLIKQLTEIKGVAEASIFEDTGEAYLKVDLHALDYNALEHIRAKN